jgi:hypothetical protein
MKMLTGSEDAHIFHVSIFAVFEHLRVGWLGVTPAAISTDPTAGAPLRSWLKSVELHSSNAPRSQL